MIDPHEPQCLQEMRRELRVRRKALETERAYAGWVGRFMRHCDSDDLRLFGEREIKSFLTKSGNLAGSGCFRRGRCRAIRGAESGGGVT